MAASVAMPLSTQQDFFSPRPLEEEEEEEEEEEDVVVKSKPIPNRPIQLLTGQDEEEDSAALEDVIDDSPMPQPPNGGSSVYSRDRLPMLDLAEVSLTSVETRGDGLLGPSSNWVSTASAASGEFGLSGKFRVQGKCCVLRLEDDMLQWTWAGKKGAQNKEVLSLADIFAVVVVNSRGRPDVHGTQFVIHALKSKPGSCGDLIEVTCQPLDPHPAATSQTWGEYLSQQIQNFGHRPRRLYVVINPTSGNGCSLSTWSKVEPLFKLANVHTEIFVTQRRFQAREIIQSLAVDQYDGIIVVGGDGIFNEVLNGLILQTQQSAGIDLRRGRFVPVQPNIRLGIIPAGFSNSVAWSVLGTRNPKEAAAQVLLGSSSPIDVCSLFNSGQLLLFSAGALSYGVQAEATMFTNDFTWLGQRRVDIAQIRAVLTKRDFETDLMYIPMTDNDTLSNRTERDKCYSRCPKCSNFDGVQEPQGGALNEKGASVMAASYSNVDRSADQLEWKRITGTYSTVIACPLTCRSRQAPEGLSPWAHQANGGLDLILVRGRGKLDTLKWFIHQRRVTQLNLPYVQIYRVKEFKFREILTQPQRAEEEINLVSDTREDDDEVTNRSAGMRGGGGGRIGRQQSHNILPTSHWNIDGDDLNRVDIEVRVHRHLLVMFARGVEPIFSNSDDDEEILSGNESFGDTIDREGSEQLIPAQST